jgi:uncharacterized membrane protein YhaH (DUF805 family)
MQAGLLIFIFLLTAIVVQAIGLGVSRFVDSQFPAAGMPTFLIVFLAAYFIAWPIAVRITEWLIVRSGRQLQQPDPAAK